MSYSVSVQRGTGQGNNALQRSTKPQKAIYKSSRLDEKFFPFPRGISHIESTYSYGPIFTLYSWRYQRFMSPNAAIPMT